MIYIFDIDGTLADISHRLHFIEQEKPDWDAFYAASGDDSPIWEVITVARALAAAKHVIIMSTGRSEDIRAITNTWLTKYRVPCSGLFMRASKDYREDNVVKGELLDRILAEFVDPSKLGRILAGVFEDRQQVVDMYRARDIRVFQVAPGKF